MGGVAGVSEHMQQNDNPLVIGLGEVLWDLLPGGKQFGGAPANFAYHAGVLGAEAYVVSSVGDDDLGREILCHLDGLGLSREFVAVDCEHSTGTVSVEVDARGRPNYVIHENVAWDFISPTAYMVGLAEKADAVCFGTLAQRSTVSRVTIRDFLAATHNHCLRIFDVNLRQRFYNVDTVARGLSQATVLKLNDEELPVITEMLSISRQDGDPLLTLLRRFGLKMIALTRGERGSELISREGRSTHLGFPAEVADTVGAGDAFTAALAMGMIRGLDPERINEHANRVAQYVCTQPGATPELPEELLRFA